MQRLGLTEMFGVRPLRKTAVEVALMLRGDEYTPASRFDLSSVKMFKPRLAIRTWLGRTRDDRRVPITNLFNHDPTPVEDGWSVRVTQVRDFRGGQRTYDSHNGTDFAVPVGTTVVAAAPGRVARVCSEFHRGGLKVVLDHGRGLITTSNHLGRALVRVGDIVERGQPVALSGASGVDMVAAFPWNLPHVHYNVWLNGEAVDPFSCGPHEPAIWRDGNEPAPSDGGAPEAFEPPVYDLEGVDEAIRGCRDPALRAALEGVEDLETRAVDTIFHMIYFPTRFDAWPRLYRDVWEREPRLTLPFRPQDYVGISLDDR